MKIWDNILESRGPAARGESRLNGPGGVAFSDLGKDCAHITASHTRQNANLTVHDKRLINIIMLTGRNVMTNDETLIPYPIVYQRRNKLLFAA